MRLSHEKRRHPLSASLMAVVLAAGTAIVHAEPGQAVQGMHAVMQHPGGMQMHGAQHGKAHHGGVRQGPCGMHSKKHGKQHGKMHGAHGKGHHLLGSHWRQSLTDDQKAQLDRLHLEYAKKKLTLKSGMKALKTQLAVLATADEPQAGALDAQINELLMAKRQLMVAKYEYIAAQRRVLTPEQRVSFDMDVLHKAADSGKDTGHHGGGHR